MPTGSLKNLLKRKRKTKKVLSHKLGLDPSFPMLGVVLDKKLSVKDEKNIKKVFEGASRINVNVVVLTDSNVFDDNMAKHIKYSRDARQELLEASDMSLSFSFSDVQEILLNGTVPISCIRGEILDYNPNNEIGNGFVYDKNDYWCIFATLVRALETFKFPYDWSNIVRQGLKL